MIVPTRAGLEALAGAYPHNPPGLAAARGWPVRNDHCFQRILLDAVCNGRWYDHVPGRPAYRAIDAERLAAAILLAEKVAHGEADLHALNAQSLRWRGKRLPASA